MAIKSIDFGGRLRSSVGRFSRSSARKAVRDSFKDLGLTTSQSDYFARELDHGGKVTGEKYNKIVNGAVRRGKISVKQAEKLKDASHIPDSCNKHYKQ